MSKNKCVRYKPEAKNIFYSPKSKFPLSQRVYSGFRRGISFGTKKKAQKFIQKIKKQGIYKKFRIKKIKC